MSCISDGPNIDGSYENLLRTARPIAARLLLLGPCVLNALEAQAVTMNEKLACSIAN